MTITATPYGKFLMNLGSGQFNLGSDAIKIMLTTAAYVPNIDTHEFKSDVTNEITGTGYTAGGASLTGVTWTYDATNKRGVLGASAVVWTAATFTLRYAVIFKWTGTATTSRLIGWIDFGQDLSPASEDFTISFTSGVVRRRAHPCW